MRMMGTSMCAAAFYSMSGEAVEVHGLDGEECEPPGTEEAFRAREFAVAIWCLILTSLIHAIFISALTKKKTPAAPGQEWTDDTKHQKLKRSLDLYNRESKDELPKIQSTVEKSHVPNLPNIFSRDDDKSSVEIKPKAVKMEKDN